MSEPTVSAEVRLSAVASATGASLAARPSDLGVGAAAARATDGSAWIWLGERSIGAGLLWMVGNDCGAATVVVDGGRTDAGHLARRAGHFDLDVDVVRWTGTELEPVAAEAAPSQPPLDADVAAFVTQIRDAGADPVPEWGILVAEVMGLEVARALPADEHGPARLAVGVGEADREITAMIQGDAPAADVLANVVAYVRRVREPQPATHPLGRLVPERRLRRRLIDDPSLIGAATLAPVPPPEPPPGMTLPFPAFAAGEDTDGQPLVVACSAGIDPEALPLALEVVAADDRQPRLVLATASATQHPAVAGLADRAAASVELASVAVV